MSGKKNAEGAVALAGDAAFFEFGAEWGEGIVVGAFAEAFVEFDAEKVVEFLEFVPGEFDGFFPDGEVFGVTGLEFHQFLARGAFNVLVGFLEAGDLAVEADEFGDGILFQSLAVEEVFPAVNDLAELRAPVADVVVGGDFVAKKTGDAHEAVAEDRAADMADMHRLGDIRGAEIDKNFFRVGGGGDAEPGVGGEGGNGGGDEGIFEAEVDESGTGDLGGGGEGGDIELREDVGGELARVGFFLLGQDHGGVRLIVAEAGVGGLGDFASCGVEFTGGKRVAESGGEEFARGGHGKF